MGPAKRGAEGSVRRKGRAIGEREQRGCNSDDLMDTAEL